MESVAYIPASWRGNWIKPFLFTLLILLTQSACPNNPEPLECGENQIEVNGTCECVEGYHWNEDQTQCNMDTTSHDFMWELDSIGTTTISSLREVAIIDEKNIWVVGNIETDSGSFNAARWDGSEWELMSIYNNALDLYSIKYFSENDIWVTSHCFPYRWDGSNWTQYHLNDMGMDGLCAGNAIWGTSSSNLYFIGGNGTIVHYDGNEFTSMESGTEVNLLDIYGTPNGDHVFVVGYNDSGESIALEVKEGAWHILFGSDNYLGDPENGDYGRFQSIHLIGDTAYFATGGTWLVKYNYKTEETIWIPKYKYFSDGYRFIEISGNSPNDLMLKSAWGSFFHYNGVDWYYDDTIYNIFGPSNFYPRSGEMNDDIAVIVGVLGAGYRGIAIRGYREE